jgi:hypothetical protein
MEITGAFVGLFCGKKHAEGFAGGFWKVEPQKHNCKKAEKTWRE